MALVSNRQGFLIGERIVDSIDLVGKDTAEILALMKQGYKRSQRNEYVTRHMSATQDANDVGGSSGGRQKIPKLDDQTKSGNPKSNANPTRNTNPMGDSNQTREIGASARNKKANALREASEPAVVQRDAKGRFAGGRDSQEPDKNSNPEDGKESNKNEGLIKKSLAAIAEKIHAPDSDGVDPTIDALKEAGVFKAISVVANTGSWLFGKFGKKDEDKPKKDKSDDEYKNRNKSQFGWLGSIFSAAISALKLPVTLLAGGAAAATAAYGSGAWLGTKARQALGMNDDDSKLNEGVGGITAHIMSALGSKNAQDAVDLNNGIDTNPKKYKYDKVVSAGKGFNIIQNSDGSVVKHVGARNWRNNNSGNIEDGDFARKNGAIGSDGRFAIFPTYQAGRNAKEKLIFGSDKYKDLNLTDAISRYAPPIENDTKKYQSAVLSAVGGANKPMSSYSNEDRQNIMDVMEKVEGYKVGQTAVIKAANIPDTSVVDQSTTTPASANLRDATKRVSMAVPQTAPSPKNNALPAAPKTQTKVSSNTPMQSAAPQVSDAISQNLADRNLAHSVTGGLGMDRLSG
jgi:hypothetical protein